MSAGGPPPFPRPASGLYYIYTHPCKISFLFLFWGAAPPLVRPSPRLCGAAYERLEEIAAVNAGRVGTGLKMYLFAQRDAAALRVFTGRFPPQTQPF